RDLLVDGKLVAAPLPTENRREPEVDEHGPLAREHEDVLGLEVAVDDALAVQERERRAQPAPERRNRAERFGREPPSAVARDADRYGRDIVAKVRAFEQLHRVPRQPAFDAFVDDADDAGVAQTGERVDLAPDAREQRL